MSKRTFPKSRFNSSTTYDASEEDLTDTDASIVSIPPAPQHGQLHPPRSQTSKKPSGTRARHHLAASILSDDGVDSPTYDGDVESSAIVTHSRPYTPDTVLDSSASASTLTSPVPATIGLPDTVPHAQSSQGPPSPAIGRLPLDRTPTIVHTEPAPAESAKELLDTAKLTPEDIQTFVRDAINGGPTDKGVPRLYKIAPPPVGRPVRIYADGVYDLFHFGHALQLRQAKLAFPEVYLMVGCNSDEQVRQHKNKCVQNHIERCESLRHCRWVDQVIPEAPWVLTPEFIAKHAIDYVAHDEDPYAGVGVEDIYQPVKDMGKFLPTRRTPGVSTSELLERIVSKYRLRDFDAKLEKLGHPELKAAGSDYDDADSSEEGRKGRPRAQSRRRVKEGAKDTLLKPPS